MGWYESEPIHGNVSGGFGLMFARHINTEDYESGDRVDVGYSVTLPHQCDQWSIAGDEYDPVSLEVVKARLSVFAADVQATLAAVNAYRPGEVTDG